MGCYSLSAWQRALALAISFIVSSGSDAPEPQITLTAGREGTTRTLFARMLAREITARGVDTRVVPAATTLDIYRLVETHALDFAIVNGSLDIERFTHVREVMPLDNEALHLLIKPELANAVEQSYGALRGRTVNLGAAGLATAGIAKAVLTLARVLRQPHRATLVISSNKSIPMKTWPVTRDPVTKRHSRMPSFTSLHCLRPPHTATFITPTTVSLESRLPTPCGSAPFSWTPWRQCRKEKSSAITFLKH